MPAKTIRRGANPLHRLVRLGGIEDRNARTKPMKRSLIRYKTKPDRADENERLIKAVFEELRAKAPDNVRYLALRLGDGTFVHFVADEGSGGSPIPGLAAFRAFQSGIKDRCVEPPQSEEAAIVGNYRMLEH
jgi:hypothetical protein